nr:NADPH:quinone reductase [Kribbella italica]
MVRVHAAGVNPADTYIRAGGYAFFHPPLPYTPGFDGAGVVEAVGAEVSAVAVGDRVFVAALGVPASGTYAQQLICDVAAVHPLPGHLTFHQGAGFGVPWTTAYRALFQRGELEAGETVLVHGASGGVGHPTVQLAIAAGATVIGTAGTEEGLDQVRSLGAAHILNHRTPGYLDTVPELTGGRGIDLVVEMLADQNLEADALLLAQRGRVVVVGSRGSLTFTPRTLMAREADVRGTALWNLTPAEKHAALSGVSDFLAAHQLIATPATVYPLDEAARAHEELATQPAVGKRILNCS